MSRLKVTAAALKAARVFLRFGDAEQFILQEQHDEAGKPVWEVFRTCNGEYSLMDARNMVADLKHIEVALDEGKLPLDQCEPG